MNLKIQEDFLNSRTKTESTIKELFEEFESLYFKIDNSVRILVYREEEARIKKNLGSEDKFTGMNDFQSISNSPSEAKRLISGYKRESKFAGQFDDLLSVDDLLYKKMKTFDKMIYDDYNNPEVQLDHTKWKELVEFIDAKNIIEYQDIYEFLKNIWNP